MNLQQNQNFLLIAGIPGTGKTEIGNYLADEHNFFHLDVEELMQIDGSRFVSLKQTPDDFIHLLKQRKKVVVTWGFMPGIDDCIIRKFQLLGFKFIWFDGNRKAARNAFIRRGTVSEDILDIQMRRIEKMDIGSFSPVVVNTFDGQDNFLEREKIVKEIFKGLE